MRAHMRRHREILRSEFETVAPGHRGAGQGHSPYGSDPNNTVIRIGLTYR
ncbi:hypothetical protein GCM10009574_080100 [Streptomyces asiaticus]|uniref:Transposase n=2 Tax=Streptomyces rhizosphaericus TaxID=114699 RepID=A0ABN1SGR8_9ACTN